MMSSEKLKSNEDKTLIVTVVHKDGTESEYFDRITAGVFHWVYLFLGIFIGYLVFG